MEGRKKREEEGKRKREKESIKEIAAKKYNILIFLNICKK